VLAKEQKKELVEKKEIEKKDKSHKKSVYSSAGTDSFGH